MDQAQLELQLKVWKDLAISKQILMRAATKALKLDPETTQEDLKKALDGVLKKLAMADADVASAQEQARQTVAAMEKKVAACERAQTQAEATVQDLQTKLDNTTRGVAAERAASTKEIQRLKDALADKEKALKSINTALADTPENVLKKMNALKKQRQEEADARRQVEATLNSLRTDKRKQDQQTADMQKNTGKLITQHRELHELSLKLRERLEGAAPDAKDVPAVPELDSKLIEEIEQPDAKNGKDTKEAKKEAKGAKAKK